MSYYTDLTKYHEANIPVFIKVLDGQEWVFVRATIAPSDMVTYSSYDVTIGFGQPKYIEDFPELSEYDNCCVAFWFHDINEALALKGSELWYDARFIDFTDDNCDEDDEW